MSWSCTTADEGGTGGEGDAPLPTPEATREGATRRVGFKIYLRDIHEPMVAAWEDKQAFGTDSFKDLVEVSRCSLAPPPPLQQKSLDSTVRGVANCRTSADM